MATRGLFIIAALVFGGLANAQGNDWDGLISQAPEAEFSGVYHVATRNWDYGHRPDGSGDDLLFNQSALMNAYISAMADGNTYVDEGRVPSLTSVTPVGTQDSYTITGFEIAYCTSEQDASFGGPGARFILGFYDKYGPGCAGLDETTPATVLIEVVGAPGSPTPGSTSCHFIFIDMAGFEFCLSADGEGRFDGEDLFGFSFQMLDAVSGAAGAMIAGDPDNVSDDTVFTTGGAGVGSGLGAVDQIRREPDGASGAACIVFGYPGNNFASMYLKLEGLANGMPCAGCPGDDRFDYTFPTIGDDCADPVALSGPMMIENLTANGPDQDYFSLTVPAGSVIGASALFSHAQADIDLRLHDVGCGNTLDFSVSVTDDEHVAWQNTSGSPIDVILQVYTYPPGSPGECGDYALDVSIGPAGGYCSPTTNSTGSAALISMSGSFSIADNDFTLSAGPVPNSPYLYFFGPNQITLPFGNGVRCVGGGITRVRPAQVASGNMATRAINLQTPAIEPGVLNFQCWFRDLPAGGSQFNLSNGFEAFIVP